MLLVLKKQCEIMVLFLRNDGLLLNDDALYMLPKFKGA
jgi:hypothetical protein